MGIFRSYSNFMTKGGGVVEGRSDPDYYGKFNDNKRRRRKIGTKYTCLNNKKVPDDFTLIKTCLKVAEISPYIDKMTSRTRGHFKIDLKKGFVVTIRGGLYIKQQNNKFLVYTKAKSKENTSAKMSNSTNTKAESNSYDEIYQNLLRVKNKSDKKRT